MDRDLDMTLSATAYTGSNKSGPTPTTVGQYNAGTNSSSVMTYSSTVSSEIYSRNAQCNASPVSSRNGSGGSPSSMYPNCSPMSTGAPVQRTDTSTLDGSPFGGVLSMPFSPAIASFGKIGIINAKTNYIVISVIHENGTTSSIAVPNGGQNSRTTVALNAMDVTRIDIDHDCVIGVVRLLQLCDYQWE
jgi:hypothetical protein